mmetsp:Transcript_19750/g.65335  ORF Transcript_19750/g.65335 Transcript_19750/m.65335 type:complete len:210 (+) Transcript_19750:87-716(+)
MLGRRPAPQAPSGGVDPSPCASSHRPSPRPGRIAVAQAPPLLLSRLVLELAHRVREQRHECAHVLRHRARPAGQVDDEALAANAGGGAGEGGERLVPQRLAEQQLGEAGQRPLHNGERRLGRHVARREAGTSRGEDEVGDVAVCPARQHLGDRVGVVGHNLGSGQLQPPARARSARRVLSEATLDLCSRRVCIDSGSGAVARRQHRNAE